MPDSEPGTGDEALPAYFIELADQLQAGNAPIANEKVTALDLEVTDKMQTIQLKRTYARGLLILLAIQIAVADVLVYLYAALGRAWDVPAAVIHSWLAATVFEVLGVVAVIVRHLFPHGLSDSN